MKLRHFWAQIVSWAPRHARKTFIVLAHGLWKMAEVVRVGGRSAAIRHETSESSWTFHQCPGSFGSYNRWHLWRWWCSVTLMMSSDICDINESINDVQWYLWHWWYLVTLILWHSWCPMTLILWHSWYSVTFVWSTALSSWCPRGCYSMLSAVARVPEAMLIALQDTQQSQQIPFIIINYFVYRSL